MLLIFVRKLEVVKSLFQYLASTDAISMWIEKVLAKKEKYCSENRKQILIDKEIHCVFVK